MELRRDLSDLRKITFFSSSFMGLSHIVFLKDYIKGAFFILCEVLFLCFLPSILGKLTGLVTLGSPHPELPIKMRDNSIFMMIDGILVLALVAFY